jgi:hypothetical protein
MKYSRSSLVRRTIADGRGTRYAGVRDNRTMSSQQTVKVRKVMTAGNRSESERAARVVRADLRVGSRARVVANWDRSLA